MRFFLWNFALNLFWVIFETSFLEILFPLLSAPLSILALIVAVGIILPFKEGLWLTLLTVFLFDLSRAGVVTSFIFFALPLLGVTHFFRIRFLPEATAFVRPASLFFYATVVLVYELCTPFFSRPVLSSFVIGMIIFPIVFFSLYRLNNWLTTNSLSEFRGLRQS